MAARQIRRQPIWVWFLLLALALALFYHFFRPRQMDEQAGFPPGIDVRDLEHTPEVNRTPPLPGPGPDDQRKK